MTSPVRLLVSDVDGTLVTSDKRLTPSSITAAAALREAGIGLALVSSRPPRGIASLAAQLGPDIPIAGFNGGTIVDAGGRTLSQHLVPAEAARIALATFDRLGIDCW